MNGDKRESLYCVGIDAKLYWNTLFWVTALFEYLSLMLYVWDFIALFYSVQNVYSNLKNSV